MNRIRLSLLTAGVALIGLVAPVGAAQEVLGISEQFSAEVLRAPFPPAQIQPCPACSVRDSIGLQEGLTTGKGN